MCNVRGSADGVMGRGGAGVEEKDREQIQEAGMVILKSDWERSKENRKECPRMSLGQMEHLQVT